MVLLHMCHTEEIGEVIGLLQQHLNTGYGTRGPGLKELIKSIFHKGLAKGLTGLK